MTSAATAWKNRAALTRNASTLNLQAHTNGLATVIATHVLR